jgi:hypothetical protein
MMVGGIAPGDIVKVDKRGRIFYALVEDNPREEPGLHIVPLDRRISYRAATGREVVEHYRKAGNHRRGKARA